MKTISKKILYALLLTVILSCCSQYITTSNEDLFNDIQMLYTIDVKKTQLKDSRTTAISLLDKQSNELRLYIVYDTYNQKNNCIIYYNIDSEIPVKLYYALEPNQMYYEEKLAYEAFKEELEKDYRIFLKQFGNITNDDLLSLAKWIDEKRG